MAVPSLADTDTLSARVGGIPNDKVGQATALLRAASAFVRATAGRTWLTEDGDLDPDLPEEVVMVVVEVAARVWYNPEGAIREQIDDYSTARPDRGGELFFLTDTERAVLADGTVTGTVTGLSSIRVEAPAAASASRLLYGGYFDCDEEVDEDLGS